MVRIISILCLLLAPCAASATQFPPALQTTINEQFADCREFGGNPSLGPAYATMVDLDGDGAQDYIIDLAGFVCEGAWSVFCGSAGCPVAIWRSDGTEPSWGGFVQAWELSGAAAKPSVLVHRHGSMCPGSRSGAEGCSAQLKFVSINGVPSITETAAAPPAPQPDPEPAPEEAAVAEAAGPPPAPVTDAAWTLRDVPDSGPVAVVGGPGAIDSLSAFCLGGQPWLAVVFREQPEYRTSVFEFTFSSQTYGVEAAREDGAGGAYVLALRDGALARLLSGRDTEAALRVDAVDQGILTLRGSTVSIRGALADCFDF